MPKNIFIIAIMAFSATIATAQSKYFTKTGTVTFISNTPLETIDAINKKSTCIVNTENGQIDIALLQKAFEFKKALLQEHYNENYVESDKYPKATFKGKIENLSTIDFKKDGVYNAIIIGDMTMHGVTKNMKTNGTFTVKDGKISANSVFSILLADYNISIPSAVKDKISKEIRITVDMNLDPLAK